MAVSWEDSQPDTHSYILLLMLLFCHSSLYFEQGWLNTFNFESQEYKYSSKFFKKDIGETVWNTDLSQVIHQDFL